MLKIQLKRYLEMRGADGGPWRRLCALPAFWVELFYDEESLQSILDMTYDWTKEEREMLRRKVPVTGFKTPFRDGYVRHLAEEVLTLAKNGLERRGYKEAGFLREVEEVVSTVNVSLVLAAESTAIRLLMVGVVLFARRQATLCDDVLA